MRKVGKGEKGEKSVKRRENENEKEKNYLVVF